MGTDSTCDTWERETAAAHRANLNITLHELGAKGR